MTGKIIKGIAGFYYVYVEETKEAKETATGGTLYEDAKQNAPSENKKIKPLVGDTVDIAVLDEEKHIGNVERILPRKNELIGRLCPYRHGPWLFLHPQSRIPISTCLIGFCV